ncbi:MAG: AIR synthase-related protein [Collinsella aerofaciens]
MKPILGLLHGGANVHAIAHITGGGITENLNRALADDVDAVVTRRAPRWAGMFRPSSPTCRVRPSSRPMRHARPSTWASACA